MNKKDVVKKMSPSDEAKKNLSKHFKSPEFKKHLDHQKELEDRKKEYYKFLHNPTGK